MIYRFAFSCEEGDPTFRRVFEADSDATFLDLSIKGEFNKAMNYWVNDLGGITLREAAIDRMMKGIVDIEEVERWTGLLDQPILA